MFCVVGLGNPDKKYSKNMHNMGFMAIDYIAEKLNVSFDKKGYKSVYSLFNYNGEKVILVKPQTYMNLSGEAVQEVMSFYKLSPQNLIVIYDDLDIDIGSLRVRAKGSSGTHNGMRNIVQMINSQDFIRFRIGTKPKNDSRDIVDYVLSDIKKEDEASFKKVFEKTYNGVVELLNGKNIENVMCKYNG